MSFNTSSQIVAWSTGKDTCAHGVYEPRRCRIHSQEAATNPAKSSKTSESNPIPEPRLEYCILKTHSLLSSFSRIMKHSLHKQRHVNSVQDKGLCDVSGLAYPGDKSVIELPMTRPHYSPKEAC